MDWPVTARTLVPHVRQTIADRELETWLVVDLSPSIDFGTAFTEKRELVLAAITAVVHLTVARRQPRRRDRDDRRGKLPNPGAVGPVARPVSDPQDRADAPGKFRRARRPGRGYRATAPAAAPPRAGRDHLGLSGLLRRRAQQHDRQRQLGTSVARAGSGAITVVGIEVVDPRELELPAAGLMTFVDPETGEQVEVQTSRPDIRARYAAAAAEQRDRIATTLRHAGAAHLQLRTDRDWLTDVVRFVVAQRRALVGSGVR